MDHLKSHPLFHMMLKNTCFQIATIFTKTLPNSETFSIDWLIQACIIFLAVCLIKTEVSCAGIFVQAGQAQCKHYRQLEKALHALKFSHKYNLAHISHYYDRAGGRCF